MNDTSKVNKRFQFLPADSHRISTAHPNPLFGCIQTGPLGPRTAGMPSATCATGPWPLQPPYGVVQKGPSSIGGFGLLKWLQTGHGALSLCADGAQSAPQPYLTFLGPGRCLDGWERA